MATDLTRIGEKARKEPKLVFTSLYHHIYDVDNLRACYEALGAHKATGVDGVTKAEYGVNLEENLRDLSARLRRMDYRPGPKRRSYIPKPGTAKGRPLGISNLEDKIVEAATKRVLERIYEADFTDSSYGYRPQRTQHQCLDALGRTIQQQKVSFVVEADVKSFFDEVNHHWLVQFLRHRIGDDRVIRLIIRMLKSGIPLEGALRQLSANMRRGKLRTELQDLENDLRAGARIGPFAHLRPQSDVAEGAHVGNFVELKKTTMGKGAKANHLAYVGDATVGAGANIGAGTITCNYDGEKKHPTIIGEGAFIGSDSILVAPLEIGALRVFPPLVLAPMAGITNAMNMAHKGSYKELQSIAPGGVWQESFWIRPSGF